jgi:cellobiose phosphorylase
MSNLYGQFSADDREYVITDPRTPRPWFNYMWNGHYTGLVSHTGGGFSFLDSPRDNRITRMRYNSLPWDRPGRYVLVKDKASGKYWSLSWAPTIALEYDRYECRHGQGYTTIITEIFGVRGEITYFVPNSIDAEIWRVSLTDLTGSDRSLEIYAFVELIMGNALNDIINQPNDKHFTDIHFNSEQQSLVATRRYWVLNRGVSVKQPNIDWQYQVHFSQTLPVTGFDSSLDAFIGRWRSEANPIAVEKGMMGSTEITAGDPIAALQSKVELPANGTLDFAIISEITKKGETPKLLNQSTDQSLEQSKLITRIDQEFSKLRQKWDSYLANLQVDTPDRNFNTLLNVWNPYQAAVTFDMARNAGYYHGGLLFGTGMRDQFQDILGVVMVEPQRVRSRLLNALRFQFQDGSTLHNFFKLTNTGERTNHSDTPLWIPFGLIEYLNETADFSILEESVPFHDPGSENFSGTVYEHMIAALDYVIANLSDRGMQKIRNGDWNDTLDHIGAAGKGETIWGSFFLGYILQKVMPLLEHRGDRHNLDKFQALYAQLRTVLNETSWDGEWYLRAFRDDGSAVGSASHSQGQIFLNAQSWAVISGLAPQDRGDQALASCRKHLATAYGMQIVYPSYTEIEDNTGLISRCVPGKKENGAVFNHASSWFVLASLLNGDVDFGYEIYQRMMPLNSSQDSDRYEVEPYVYAEYVTSPDHSSQGQASHSWLTGTAVWMLRIGTDYILGFRPTLAGMIIDPHIPRDWQGFQASRKFRGKTINLSVSNPDRQNSGVTRMIVNGEEVAGNFLDLDLYAEAELVIAVTIG